MAASSVKQPLKLLMAQLNPTVGAVTANTEQIIQIITQYQSEYDLIVFPELAITGYPIEDLVFRDDWLFEVETALQTIIESTGDCHVVVGHPSRSAAGRLNSASILYQKCCIKTYHKHHLPHDDVFDEPRYFKSGELDPCIIRIKDDTLGLIICEDLWQPGPAQAVIDQHADILVVINASPFHRQKYQQRLQAIQQATQHHLATIYVNQVGGQDELVFDGRSLFIDKQGKICGQAPAFKAGLLGIDYQDAVFSQVRTPLLTPNPQDIRWPMPAPLPASDDEPALIYQALICGLRDYVNKNQFPGVLLGLSGGVDSALSLALAVDALGAHRVTAVFMPSRYTARISQEDALAQIQTLGVKHFILPIEDSLQSVLATLSPALSDYAPDVTEENLQARIRGLLLMALSNKTHHMLLSTSNKSEVAVGYTTLYGDMCGGFAVLKDVYKTMVYTLCHYRNHVSPIIPARVLTRPPSAELAFDQTDQDNLPAYDLLDKILEGYIENRLGADALIAQGYPEQSVRQVIRLITKNEYKRYQSPPGVKITSCAFGKDWRYPLTKHI